MEKYVTRRQRRELKTKKRKRILIALVVIAILCFVGFVVVPFAIRHAGVRLSRTNKNGSESIVYADPGSLPDERRWGDWKDSGITGV